MKTLNGYKEGLHKCTHITSALISDGGGLVRETEVYQDLDVGVRHGRTIKSERL